MTFPGRYLKEVLGGKNSAKLQKEMGLNGLSSFLILMALSFNVNAQWVSVVPAEVSDNWGLNKIRILSSGNGWAVGVDVANKRGVILQVKDHIWSAVNPPNVSSNLGAR